MPIADRQRPPPGEQFLDHVAHFVPDLAKAGALLEALGFAVTPVSVHSTQHGPAGSSNRCLMLSEGYIEILAPTADTPNARRLRKWMRRYRGVHLVCFGTPTAEEDHFRLTKHGFAPQPLVKLRRKQGTASETQEYEQYQAEGGFPCDVASPRHPDLPYLVKRSHRLTGVSCNHLL